MSEHKEDYNPGPPADLAEALDIIEILRGLTAQLITERNTLLQMLFTRSLEDAIMHTTPGTPAYAVPRGPKVINLEDYRMRVLGDPPF